MAALNGGRARGAIESGDFGDVGSLCESVLAAAAVHCESCVEFGKLCSNVESVLFEFAGYFNQCENAMKVV